MTANKAYLEVMKKASVARVVSCYEYDSMFVFQLAPEHIQNPTRIVSGLTCVIKATGEVRTFKPCDITAEEYENGKLVPSSVYGGD